MSGLYTGLQDPGGEWRSRWLTEVDATQLYAAQSGHELVCGVCGLLAGRRITARITERVSIQNWVYIYGIWCGRARAWNGRESGVLIVWLTALSLG